MRKFFVIGKGSGSGPAPEPQPFPTTPEDNQVFYKSISGAVIGGWNNAFMDENGDPMEIESNVYQDGYGILTFADDVKGMGMPNSSRYILPSGPDVLLSDILMPDCVEYLGQNLFYALPALKSVNIPASCTAIYNNCFGNDTNLVCDIVLPEGMTTMGTSVFSKSGIKSCNWPASLTTIPQSTFDQCPNLTSFSIPATATTINNYAFRGCYNLTSMTIDPSNPNYSSGTNNDAVYDGTTLVFGFRNTVIEEGTTRIYDYAFYKQYGLTSIVIPSTVTEIRGSAFSNCSSLTAIESLPTTAPTLTNNTFQGVGMNGVLTVHNADYSTWMQTGNYYLGRYNWTCVGGWHHIKVNVCDGNGTMTVNGTQVTPDANNDWESSYADGTQITLAMTTDSAHSFCCWYDRTSQLWDDNNYTSYDNPVTITMSGDYTIDTQIDTLLNVTLLGASGQGKVGWSGQTPDYSATKTGMYPGMCEDIYAYPETGYEFVEWQSSDFTLDSPTINPSYICPNNDGTITAVFQAAAPQSQPNDEFWYTTSDGNMLNVNSPFDASVVSHTYTNGKGIIKCDSNITTVNNSAFNRQLTLETFSLPDSVTTINQNAFSASVGDNSSLLSCEIGSGVTNIGKYAFGSNVNCTSFTFYATTPPTLGNTIFINNTNFTIYVPAASVTDYQAASGWSQYSSHIQAIQ